MASIRKLLTSLYTSTPAQMRVIFRPAQIILRNVFIQRIKLWSLRGHELNSKQEMSILYAGQEGNMNYFIGLAFDGKCEVKYIGTCWLFNLSKIAKSESDIYSILVAELPRFLVLNLKNSFQIPCWVRGEVDISGDIAAIMKKTDSLQSAARNIKKNSLYYEITNDEAKFHDFYYNMYLPYITKRYDNAAAIEPYELFKSHFHHCDLLLIKSKNQVIAGGLICYEWGKVRLWSFGINDANPEYVQMGAFGALYFFSLQYLKDKGFLKVGLGGSRPFLNNGVIVYKKRWGLKLTEPFEINYLLKPLKITNESKSFLINNPFIFTEKGKFNCAVMMNEQFSIDADVAEDLNHKYYYPGINTINVFSFKDKEMILVGRVPGKATLAKVKVKRIQQTKNVPSP